MIIPSLRALRVRGPSLVRRMASNPTAEDLGLKGMQVYFNAYTTVGRRNIVVATYGVFFGLIFLYKSRKSKTPEEKSA
ncbi:Up-regulated during skeletal muscle growth protein 5 [Exaiptasia diaphana]|nr:Up-regulated during skeletal muscle growth protein 5 [Exaiptasia diaphana]